MGIGTLVIRADASPEIGVGHVMRCLALAQEWQDRGGRAVFVMAACTPAIRARLSNEGCEVVSCDVVPGDGADAAATANVARQYESDWIVVDGYVFRPEYQVRVHDGIRKVLYIDDAAACGRYHAEIVLDPNLSASETSYAGCVDGAQLLLGTRFALLRREFRTWSGRNRTIPAHAGRVLVTLGGSTPQTLALKVLEALAKIQDEITDVVFVLGGSTSESFLPGRAAERLGSKVTFHKAASDMAALMAQADVAVSAAGSTCWELCFMGLPSLLIDVVANQAPEALELHKQGCAVYGGSADVVTAEGLAKQVPDLIRSEETRSAISVRCRHLVDGRGAERVVSAMLNYKPQSIHSIAAQEARL